MPETITPAPSAPDPFDPARLRLSHDFAGSVGVKKAVLTVPVRKPSKETFVRTHPDESCRLPTGILELKEDRECFLVAPELWPALSAESTFSPRLLVTSITRQDVLFLWPIRLPGPDGRIDSWNQSALEAADLARTQWTRIAANMSLGAYEVFSASADIPDPRWPDMPFADILRIAFKGRYIDTLDHAVLRRLRGEV